MNYQKFLTTEAWVPYIKHFEKENIVLKHPESLAFTIQLVIARLNELANDIYSTYPFAEKFDFNTMNAIDWSKDVYVFDTNFRMIVGPEAVTNLENLYSRLKPNDAFAFIFSVNPLIGLWKNKSFIIVVIITLLAILVHFILLFLRKYDFR